MYVLFAISLSAAAIIDERRKAHWNAYLPPDLTIGELFFGKFLASVFRGFIQTFILLVLSYAVFQIFTPLSFIESLLIALLFATACSGIGLLIASVARTGDAATWVGVFFTMTMTMLGGTFFTISKGTALYTFSKLSVNTYANDAFKTLINNGSFSTLGVDICRDGRRYSGRADIESPYYLKPCRRGNNTMKQLRNMWFLMVKDLKIFAADRAALIFAILFPFFFIVLFNFVMNGMTARTRGW